MSNNPYNPNALLDALIAKLELKNDAALARALGCAAPVLSKIRHNRIPIGATLLIRAHELTGQSVGTLRDMMGDRRERYRPAGVADKRSGVAV
jgi:plasmid maintenance system antidote protein VapI